MNQVVQYVDYKLLNYKLDLNVNVTTRKPTFKKIKNKHSLLILIKWKNNLYKMRKTKENFLTRMLVFLNCCLIIRIACSWRVFFHIFNVYHQPRCVVVVTQYWYFMKCFKLIDLQFLGQYPSLKQNCLIFNEICMQLLIISINMVI